MLTMTQIIFPFFTIYLPETTEVQEKLDVLQAHMAVLEDLNPSE